MSDFITEVPSSPERIPPRMPASERENRSEEAPPEEKEVIREEHQIDVEA